MGGDVETIKERLDIAEVVGGYVKLEKAGQSFKARCPFHSEKTPSFFVSPARQSYYCFGCGAKGDIFTFVEQSEGVDFKEALKILADRAGVELKRRTPQSIAEHSEKEKIFLALEDATQFFETQLKENDAARKYLALRGISDGSVKDWRLGYAPAEWRSLYAHMLERGYGEEILLKAGLIKKVPVGSDAAAPQLRQPYDVFRDRLIFPLKDSSGQVVAFSGRALAKESEPKYLNSPDTVVFKKHEVLYGLDKAKEKIRRKDYAVLVEGQIDLVMSHQVGIDNAIASSGTAFTAAHLERLKKLSKRIILAFDGDKAGAAAADKATELALSMGLEAKIARLPEGEDPAEVAKDDATRWKEVLRQSKPAIEHFLDLALESEPDHRKLGKLIEKKILPLIVLLESSIERSHFVSLIAKRTGIKEDIVWEDLKRVKISPPAKGAEKAWDAFSEGVSEVKNRKEQLQERLSEVRLWLKEVSEDTDFKKEEAELENNLAQEIIKDELGAVLVSLSAAETSKDNERVEELARRVKELHGEIRALEIRKEV
ncbi:MAG: primase protein [Parcubacteria group bacterium GW2011_GWA1_47_10]|uniref:DNA primase n=1 Tax=Candidatus Zambryskibacteria bacterium RIFCSPHIGHO2_01_FULL_46_25 TaxID=1802738 RepID=A0A1G2T081_9BACT|nr:MAG: primase protein [Parcubacteria group bacterium GW2011_GWA1_47_10]OHA90683.1 MAG: DNA primase [Candidatus Zambryskibacteria bacterium RIFCSPHIGHO2_01_FULL_46_25]OHB07326.1 MAG: DNA primase [Candidatus Zambryskibacteria bacterium RIFCSPLOWO2_01_FULL_48_25]